MSVENITANVGLIVGSVVATLTGAVTFYYVVLRPRVRADAVDKAKNKSDLDAIEQGFWERRYSKQLIDLQATYTEALIEVNALRDKHLALREEVAGLRVERTAHESLIAELKKELVRRDQPE